MNIVRAYKLYKLGIAINPVEQKIIEFLNSTIKNLKPFHIKSYNNRFFYYNINGQIIFETYKHFDNNNNTSLGIRIDNLWKKLELKFDNDIEIETLLLYWIKKEYGLKINGSVYPTDELNQIEKEYDLKQLYIVSS